MFGDNGGEMLYNYSKVACNNLWFKGTMDRRNTIAGDLMMAGATMIFGAMTIFSKQILAELDVYNLVALRFLIAFAVCFAVFRRRYSEMWKDRAVRKRTSIHSFVIGSFLFISYLCMVLGCKYTTASNAGFMMSLVAFFTPLILLALYRVIPSKLHHSNSCQRYQDAGYL